MTDNIKDKLQIVLITFNRCASLKQTLDDLLCESSPVRDFDITIINNNSDDGTTEMVNEYCKKYTNLTQVINKINIGGNANIAKAFTEYSTKEYIWVLADNDKYYWKSWNEIEYAINNNYDAIMTLHCENKNLAEVYYNSRLISGAIYKTSNITATVAENIYDNIHFLFPHLAIMAANINNNNKIYFVDNDIVFIQLNDSNDKDDKNLIRGINPDELAPLRRNIFISVGYFTSIELIQDKNKRNEIIEGRKYFKNSLFDLFKIIMIKNRNNYNNYFQNLYRIYRVLNFSQRIKFIMAYFVINFSLRDYTFFETSSINDWKLYFDKINEKKYISRLSKKLKNRKVLLYGAGRLSEILIQNYDLSKLNIIGICDRKFEISDETSFKGIKAIKPSELKNTDFDTILFSMKLYKDLAKYLRSQNINANMLSMIKNDWKYALRS